MGYILPIENYQAKYYQERVTQPDQDPMPIERPYPIRLETHDNIQTNQGTAQEDFTDLERDKSENSSSQPLVDISSGPSQIYAQLTGIGGQVNLYV
ncbi:hypothetical protein [Amphibacillus cookii]|uniref:hypothetical protein n=1 Tax=Amphibacillus cookii TaxID=767787 RepID=UPI00195EA91A|nr:hypothetical protein [Amphibacillus cookii]MBM7540186.1 hypothetical protein [Amphibacillus cookii]